MSNKNCRLITLLSFLNTNHLNPKIDVLFSRGADCAPLLKPYLKGPWGAVVNMGWIYDIHELIFQISANLVKIPLIYSIFREPTSKWKIQTSAFFTSMNFGVAFRKWPVFFSQWTKWPEILHVNVKMKIMNWAKNSVSLLKEFSGFEALNCRRADSAPSWDD